MYLHIFGQGKETREPKENPQKTQEHREDMQTPTQWATQVQDQTLELCVSNATHCTTEPHTNFPN